MTPMRTATLLTLVLALPALAQPLKDQQELRLWAGDAPGQNGQAAADIPVVQVFLPAEGQATGASFVVLPGGGYTGLAQHEGPAVGKWLAEHGVTAFVLRYRLGPKYRHPCEMNDALRAMRTVRAHAAEWNLDPARIGILGFSAGGHLASTVCTHFTAGDPQSPDPVERVSSRPDVSVLVYPVITMGQGTHGGSRNALLGPNPDPALIELLSNEKHVTPQTPPTFLVHSTVDRTVPISNSDNYAAALKAAGVPCEYVRLEAGAHGFGMTDAWTGKCLAWLAEHKFVKAP
jgi:acetyl esterase/lipase